MTLDPTLLHERLGTDEFCRRLKALEPHRSPLFQKREKIQTRLSNTSRAFWMWIDANEEQLPTELRDILNQERQLLLEIERIDRQLEWFWETTMEAGVHTAAAAQP